MIYHKNYSHSRVPAATVTMATTNQRTRADQRLCGAPAHCARATVEYLRQATRDFISPTSGHLIAQTYPVDYRIWGFFKTHVYQKRTRDINEPKQHLVDVWSDFGQTVIDGAID